MHWLLNLYTPGEWAAIGVIAILLGKIWKPTKRFARSVWDIATVWKEVASGFPKLTSEVQEIKELLRDGMEETKDIMHRVITLEEGVGELRQHVGMLGQRTAKLEGMEA